MKQKKWMVYLGLLIVLGIGITLVIKIRRSKSTDQVIKEIAPAYGNIQSFISTTGTVQPQNRLEIKPPIGGRIEEILIREGEKVKVGQTLAWMSSTERAALLDAARAQDKEAIKYWQEAYKPTPLIAPIDGEVIVRAVEPGQTVTAFDPIIVLSDRLIVKAQVDETDIGRVKTGQAAIISLDAYPKVKVKAKVNHISYESMIVNNVIIYEVDVLPDEVPEFFRSGMSANVDIIERSRENVLLVPIEAVKREKGGDFILLSQGPEEEPVKRRVELGVSDESRVEIISGLEAEDKIWIMTEKYSPPQDTESGGNPFTPFGRRRQQDKKK